MADPVVPPGADLLMNSRGQTRLDPQRVREAIRARLDAETPAPRGIKERIVDAAIAVDQMTGGRLDTGGLMEEDRPFLTQFLHPEVDHLPKTTDRPTELTKWPAVTDWRRLPADFRSTHERAQGYAGDEIDITKTNAAGLAPVTAGDLQQWPHVDGTVEHGRPNIPGLGHFTTSIGKDARGPYLSVYDVWDFDSQGKIVEAGMGMLGKPYAIYERFDLEPTARAGTFRLKRRAGDATPDDPVRTAILARLKGAK